MELYGKPGLEFGSTDTILLSEKKKSKRNTAVFLKSGKGEGYDGISV